MGYFIAPDKTSTIESVVVDISQPPHREDLLVGGELNTDLSEPD